jgi:hypothetical protein
MPFERVGRNKYKSKESGKIFTKAQVDLYYATGGTFKSKKTKSKSKTKK